jgi:hypothetical protein
MATNVYEYVDSVTLNPLRLEGEYNADGSVTALVLPSVPDPIPDLTPLAPVLSAVLDSRTQATLTWVAPDNTGRPPLTDYRIFRSTDGGAETLVHSMGTAATLTWTETGLPTSTSPEKIFVYTVRAVNADPDGTAGGGDPSNAVTLQWAGTPLSAPTAPTNLTRSGLTSSQVTLTWAETPDTSVDKHGIYQGSTLIRDGLDALATSYVLNGLAANTTYSQISVKRHNATGWSPASNALTFTTLSGGGVTQAPLLGSSIPDNQDPVFTQIDAVRVYSLSESSPAYSGIQAYNTYSPKVIALTARNESKTDAVGHPAALRSFLMSFYYPGGVYSRDDCEIHYANGNEVDGDGAGYSSGTLPTAFINTYEALRDVIHEEISPGVRRFPRASLWVDMTGNNLRSNGSGARFGPIAQYLDGVGCSLYPAGRTISGTNPLIEYAPSGYPPGSVWSGNSRNEYAYYIDPLFDAINLWRSSWGASNLTMMGTWEIGIPIHHSLDGDGLANYVRTTPTADATDITQRPRYLVGGARVTGPTNQRYDFKGFLNYVYDSCVTNNITMREQLYWNQQSNPAIPNPWYADTGKTTPDSAHAWHNWTPGSRLADI